MAKMKFMCDTKRCIECNGCVTACKNENVGHTAPPGGDPQRRSARRDLHLGGVHALHRRPLHGGLPGRLLLPHR